MAEENSTPIWWNQVPMTESNKTDDFVLDFWKWDSEQWEVINKSQTNQNWENIKDEELNTKDSPKNENPINESENKKELKNIESNQINNFDISIDNSPENNKNNLITSQSSEWFDINKNNSPKMDWNSNLEVNLEIPKDNHCQKYVINIHFK